jgi:hypothetical protein
VHPRACVLVPLDEQGHDDTATRDLRLRLVSTNRELYALSVQADGANLPRVEDAAPWERIDAIPMLSALVMRYARNAEIAMTNLIMRGYHLARITAEVGA